MSTESVDKQQTTVLRQSMNSIPILKQKISKLHHPFQDILKHSMLRFCDPFDPRNESHFNATIWKI